LKTVLKIIERQIKREKTQGMNAAKMAKRMRIDPSLFSHWKLKPADVNRETLTRMLRGFANPADDRKAQEKTQAELLAAYLLDQKRNQPSAQLVEVQISGKSAVEEPAEQHTKDDYSGIAKAARNSQIDKKMTEALQKLIANLHRKPSLRKTLIGLSDLASS
jgi:hypothetical protein